MVKYTILSKIEIEKLISQYPVGDVLDFSIIEGGQSNSSFKVNTSEGQFVLTICDEKNYNEVKNLVHLLTHLEKHNFHTTRIISSTTRELITSYKGKSVILKKFIEGTVFRELDSKMLFQLGRNLASLHEISAPEYLPKSFPYGIDFFHKVISSPANPRFSNWLQEKQEIIKAKLSPDLPKGLIHGDVFHDNVLFTPNKILAAILDFEEACYYYKIFDLGMCIVGTCTSKGKISLAKAESFIKGYQSKRELEASEKEALQTFAEYGAVATSFWRFQQHNLLNPNEDKANSFLEMQMLADHIHSISADEFRERLF